jgi:peptidyl-tRNA hydrolase, PTH1 family
VQLLRLQQRQPLSKQFLVVGLGNPGPNYLLNRHNIGYRVAEELARRIGASFKSHKTPALVAEGRLGAAKLVIAKGNTFMNLSGGPVSALLKFYSIEPENLVVIHDELDIEFGDIRTKFSGGHAGHNGLRDIIASIGNDFHRVRFGIGRPNGQQPVADFVLQNFSSTESPELDVLIQLAADKVEGLTA